MLDAISTTGWQQTMVFDEWFESFFLKLIFKYLGLRLYDSDFNALIAI